MADLPANAAPWAAKIDSIQQDAVLCNGTADIYAAALTEAEQQAPKNAVYVVRVTLAPECGEPGAVFDDVVKSLREWGYRFELYDPDSAPLVIVEAPTKDSQLRARDFGGGEKWTRWITVDRAKINFQAAHLKAHGKRTAGDAGFDDNDDDNDSGIEDEEDEKKDGDALLPLSCGAADEEEPM